MSIGNRSRKRISINTNSKNGIQVTPKFLSPTVINNIINSIIINIIQNLLGCE